MSIDASIIISSEAGRCQVDITGLDAAGKRKVDSLADRLRSGFLREVKRENFGSSDTLLLTAAAGASNSQLDRLVADIERTLGVAAEFRDQRGPVDQDVWTDHMKQGLPGT